MIGANFFAANLNAINLSDAAALPAPDAAGNALSPEFLGFVSYMKDALIQRQMPHGTGLENLGLFTADTPLEETPSPSGEITAEWMAETFAGIKTILQEALPEAAPAEQDEIEKALETLDAFTALLGSSVQPLPIEQLAIPLPKLEQQVPIDDVSEAVEILGETAVPASAIPALITASQSAELSEKPLAATDKPDQQPIREILKTFVTEIPRQDLPQLKPIVSELLHQSKTQKSLVAIENTLQRMMSDNPRQAKAALQSVIGQIQEQPADAIADKLQTILDKVSPEGAAAITEVVKQLKALAPEAVVLPETIPVAELDTAIPVELPKHAEQPIDVVAKKLQNEKATAIEPPLTALPTTEKPLPRKDEAKAQLLDTLAQVKDKVPPKAQQAIADVMARLEGKLEKAMPKSVHQLQLEVSFGVQPKPDKPIDGEKPISAGKAETVDSVFSAIEPAPEIVEQISSFEASPVSALEKPMLSTTAPIQPAANKVPVHQGDPELSPQEQVFQSMQLSLKNGNKEMTLNLKPVELGQVQLQLKTSAQNEVSATLVAETPQAKEILEKNLDDLVQTLESHGMKVGKIAIVQGGAEVFENRNQFYEQAGDQSGQFTQSQQQNQQHSQQQQNFADMFAGFSNSFTDGGSSFRRDDTSSTQAFDTDVEGEEVFGIADAAREGIKSAGNSSVDIRA